MILIKRFSDFDDDDDISLYRRQHGVTILLSIRKIWTGQKSIEQKAIKEIII